MVRTRTIAVPYGGVSDVAQPGRRVRDEKPRVWVVLSALVYLNLLVTFDNVVSTPFIRWPYQLSIELAVGLVALALMAALGLRLSGTLKAVLAVLLLLGALTRYFDRTTLGVLGREFNLYGDFPHLHRVAEMFVTSMSLTTVLAVVAALLAVVLACLAMNWLALGALGRTLAEPAWRRGLGFAGGVALLLYVVGPSSWFALPVGSIVSKQVAYIQRGEHEKARLAAMEWPELEVSSNLEGLERADVYLIFIESYGVTLIEDAHHFEQIGAHFERMEQRLGEAGFTFASRQIHSPTFGGGSWRSHAALLSGLPIESEHLYNALLDSDRKTLVSVLRERGYRAVAAEPGIQWLWPDGRYYGYDAIYDRAGLDYTGPKMGWWVVPDQYTLYKLYQEEIADSEQPLFVKFSLIMTHIPYYPIPEYVEEWSRFDDDTAYEEGLNSVAHDAYRDLQELSTWYVRAFEYELDVLEGFLLQFVPDNALVIVVGDHQPPKLATHDNDSWAVPMHLISRRADLVRPFHELGFREGLLPLEDSDLRMEGFLELFFAAYHRDEPTELALGPWQE